MERADAALAAEPVLAGPAGPVDRAVLVAAAAATSARFWTMRPAITLADLKAGDAIMVKTTAGSGSGPGTAVMLIAGVEPILTAAPNSTRDIMSGWNLGGGGGGGEGN